MSAFRPLRQLNSRHNIAPKSASSRTTTPPSGVSVRPESRRTRFNCGATRLHQHTENASLFESVSIWMKGGWKETQGVQRPISAKKPVSESRMAWLNTFETKRKKAPHGTSSRVCDVQVAEGMGLAANSLPCQRQLLRKTANLCAGSIGWQPSIQQRTDIV